MPFELAWFSIFGQRSASRMCLEVATKGKRWKNRPVANCYMLGQRLAEHVNACGELKERKEVYLECRKLRTHTSTQETGNYYNTERERQQPPLGNRNFLFGALTLQIEAKRKRIVKSL